jgi:non-lysosomal glucosylceramidase
MKQFIFKGAKTKEISFPLGGIGSGCIGLAGNGQLIDAEIFNRPNKGSNLGFTHFAVKAEDHEKVIDARVLHSDVQPPYTGKMQRPMYSGFGFGPDRESLSGLPHFRNSTFTGTFPMARIDFEDEHFPGQVALGAFNPFIPLNEDDSSIPGAFFEISLTNTQDSSLTYTVCFSVANLYSKLPAVHTFEREGALSMMTLRNLETQDEDDPRYGDLSFGTDNADVDVTRYWYRGNWFDNLATYWKDFREFGRIKDRAYADASDAPVSYSSREDVASMAVTAVAKPGETVRVRFVLTWSTPNCINYWNPGNADCATGAGCECISDVPIKPWKNYYATLWQDSKASLRYALENYAVLEKKTRTFLDVLLASSLPPEALEAVSANLAVIKSPTCLRLTDGSLYGFEGCHWNGGSCEGSCTHVWAYTYAIPFLFPRLERSMRTLEYTHSMNPDGSMSFRLMLPVGRAPMQFRPCVDGQYVTVMRVWREYKISGDKAWLKRLWPEIKRSIEFAWSPLNVDRWDPDKDGIMEGRQHHTLDMELFGENAWLSGLYLGGLKAGANIARALADEETAAEYERVFESGRKKLNSELFNGEYFIQKIDLTDRSVLDPYAGGAKSLQNQDVYGAYWNDEKQEIIYQIADGCGIDQVLAQWHANLIGLGEIFDRDKAVSALKSIYKHNFVPNMREHFNPCRLYALNDEAGTVICAWPEGTKLPAITIVYAEETMHGFEYQAAIHMIQEGMVEEGLRMVRAVRERYDGEKRNPWNEIECGSNYARSMASYALLLTYCGFSYDAANGSIGFKPIGNPDDFTCLWSLDSGWGQVCFERDQVRLTLCGGALNLKNLRLEKPGRAPASVAIDGRAVKFTPTADGIDLDSADRVEREIVVAYK